MKPVQTRDGLFAHVRLLVVQRLDDERQQGGQRFGIDQAAGDDERHRDLERE